METREWSHSAGAIWGNDGWPDSGASRTGTARVFTIHSLLLVSLGFLFAVLLGFVIAPAYWARAVRLTTERIRRDAPMTEAEIRAERDKLRAEHAVRVHRLEAQSERARLSAARQRIEINRRDGVIGTLERKVFELNTNLEASDNARRVLEQTIVDRIPKIEARLIETRKLLEARDAEIERIKSDASKTFQALDEAMQINAQQRNEIDRLRGSLATRASPEHASGTGGARRHDTEIALRSELEALRARTRDQASLIGRLQEVVKSHQSSAAEQTAEHDAAKVATAGERSTETASSKIVRLGRTEKANDASDINVSEEAAPTPQQVTTASLNAEIATLKTANREQAEQIEKLKAALHVFEQEAAEEQKPSFGQSLRDSKVALRARLSSAERELAQQAETAKRLRSELAAANDRLARQASRYRDELRRLGSGTVPTSVRHRDVSARPTDPASLAAAAAREHEGPSRRPSLAQRIVKEFPETAADLASGAGVAGGVTQHGSVEPAKPDREARVASTAAAQASPAAVPAASSSHAANGSDSGPAKPADDVPGAATAGVSGAEVPSGEPAAKPQRSRGGGLMDRIAGISKT